jgi:hypothetical protein
MPCLTEAVPESIEDGLASGQRDTADETELAGFRDVGCHHAGEERRLPHRRVISGEVLIFLLRAEARPGELELRKLLRDPKCRILERAAVRDDQIGIALGAAAQHALGVGRLHALGVGVFDLAFFLQALEPDVQRLRTDQVVGLERQHGRDSQLLGVGRHRRHGRQARADRHQHCVSSQHGRSPLLVAAQPEFSGDAPASPRIRRAAKRTASTMF